MNHPKPEPPIPPAQIVLRLARARKAAYVRSAQPGTLAQWCVAQLDRAAGYEGK